MSRQKALLHLQCSYATPFGSAILVAQGTSRCKPQGTASGYGVTFPARDLQRPNWRSCCKRCLCSAANRTVADGLAAVDYALDGALVEASLEHGPRGRDQSSKEVAPLRRHQDDLNG